VAIVDAEDPGVARAEVWRILLQLGALDEPLRLNEERPGAPPGADPGEVEAAGGALLGYYLGGRRTDDELLGEVEAAWAGYEELTEQQLERAMDRSALAAAPVRWSTSGCRRRPTAIARRGGAGLIAGGTQPFQGLEVDPRPCMSFPRVLFSYAAPRRSPGQGLGGVAGPLASGYGLKPVLASTRRGGR
jgi:hypothetical protein